MNELVSVIVPVYNVEKYLDRCMESIVNQTYRNLEIILVDDGSPDNCPQICDEWAKKDVRIKVIHQKNAGVSMARNAGMSIASGEYWMFVDSDDYLAKNAVEVLYKRILKDGSDLAIGNIKYIYQLGNTKDIARSARILTDAVLAPMEALSRMDDGNGFFCGPCGKIYGRNIIENIIFPDISIGEDLSVWPYIIFACTKISTVAEVVYYYVQQPQSIMHTMNDTKILDWAKVDCQIARFMLNKKLFHVAKHYYTGAVHQVWKLNDKKAARNLIQDAFTSKERFCLLRKDIHSILRWGSLYIPAFKWILDWRERTKTCEK